MAQLSSLAQRDHEAQGFVIMHCQRQNLPMMSNFVLMLIRFAMCFSHAVIRYFLPRLSIDFYTV